MVNRSDPAEPMRQSMSAWMDGQLGPGDAGQACEAWGRNVEVRECWHTYHLIGDVLRSEELAAEPARAAVFLEGLRARLDGEPMPTASTPAVVPGPRPWWQARLMAPVAVAAGFAAVAGVLVVVRAVQPGARAGGEAMASGTPADITAVSGQVIRDAHLDRYLAAHRKVSNGTAVSLPGNAVRSVDTIVLENR